MEQARRWRPGSATVKFGLEPISVTITTLPTAPHPENSCKDIKTTSSPCLMGVFTEHHLREAQGRDMEGSHPERRIRHLNNPS